MIGYARLRDLARELQRRLPAELDHDALRPLAVADSEHRLDVERLEVEPVGGVVVGGDGLRVAVDHHRLVAELAERRDGVDAAVVELDALADPVRAGAEDHDARLVPGRRGLLRLAPGRVVVVRRRLDLAGARVDAAEDRDGRRSRAAVRGRRPRSRRTRPRSRRRRGRAASGAASRPRRALRPGERHRAARRRSARTRRGRTGGLPPAPRPASATASRRRGRARGSASPSGTPR